MSTIDGSDDAVAAAARLNTASSAIPLALILLLVSLQQVTLLLFLGGLEAGSPLASATSQLDVVCCWFSGGGAGCIKSPNFLRRVSLLPPLQFEPLVHHPHLIPVRIIAAVGVHID